MTKAASAAAAAALLVLSGCRQDMHDQPRYEPLQRSLFFADGRASPAKRSHKLLPPPPAPPAGYTGPSLSEILQQMRDEDDR